MELLNNAVINNAKVLRMCKNCLVLEFPSNKEIFVSRRVFNEIRKNPDIPMYLVLREYLGIEMAWLAIPMTI